MKTFKEFLNERVSLTKPSQAIVNPEIIGLIRDNQIDRVREELDKGYDMNHNYNRGWTMLHYSARERTSDMTKLLLEYGANVDVVDDNGRTPLFLASLTFSLANVEELLKQGVDANIKNNEGKLPLDVFDNSTGSPEAEKIYELLKSKTH